MNDAGDKLNPKLPVLGLKGAPSAVILSIYDYSFIHLNLLFFLFTSQFHELPKYFAQGFSLTFHDCQFLFMYINV